MFDVNPPLKVLGIKVHAPPALGIVPHASSLKTHDDFPEAYQRYLKRTADARELSVSFLVGYPKWKVRCSTAAVSLSEDAKVEIDQ